MGGEIWAQISGGKSRGILRAVEEDRAESRISKVREVKEHFATEKHSKVRATEDGRF